jgi:hypothetical protein
VPENKYAAMSLLEQLFQLRGDAPPKPKTVGELGKALRAADETGAPPTEPEQTAALPPPAANSHGPCLEDPSLPALILQPTAEAAPEAAVILGTPPQPAPASEPKPFIQVTPRPPRVAPLVAAPAAPAPGEHTVDLKVVAESALDADALIRHVATFPGVASCRAIITDAHD